MALPTASLRNKLALLFLLIMALAFGVIYFFVVPQLEQSLERDKMADLRKVAASAEGTLEAPIGSGDIRAKELDNRVRAVADAAGARVTLLGVQRSAGNEPLFFPMSDSREQRDFPETGEVTRKAAAAFRAHVEAELS